MKPSHYNPSDPRRNQLKKRLGPGIWVDQNDHLHISLTELLDKECLAHTEENMKKAEEIARKLLAEIQPQAEVVYRKNKDE